MKKGKAAEKSAEPTEEEEKLQAKYELLRKKKEEKARQKQLQAAGASLEQAPAAEAHPTAPAVAPAEVRRASAAPAASAPASLNEIASLEEKLLAPREQAAKPGVAKTLLPAGTAPPKKVISAQEAVARLAKSGGLLSPGSSETPTRPGGLGSRTDAAGASGQKRPSAGSGSAAKGGKPLTESLIQSADGGAKKRPAMRSKGAGAGASSEQKRPKVDDESLNKLWGMARGEIAEGGAGRGAEADDASRRRVVVKDLPENADDNDLKQAMRVFGRVVDARVLDRGNVGFVTFAEQSGAEDAIAASVAAAAGEKQPVLVVSKAVVVEWPRERAQGAGPIPFPALDGGGFVMLPPGAEREHLHRLDMAAVAAYYTQGGVLPELPKGPDRDLVDYSDLL